MTADVSGSGSPYPSSYNPALISPAGQLDGIQKSGHTTISHPTALALPEDPVADDEDDLFGDADDGEDELITERGDGDTPDYQEGLDIAETPGEDQDHGIDSEMAAMLNAELGGGNTGVGDAPHTEETDESPAPGGLSTVNEINHEDLSQLLLQTEGNDGGFKEAEGFGVEGGVGMRRLATGAMEDDDDADSDSSDSTD